MELEDFWQENKRWILGCCIGLVVFVIAQSIIGERYAARWSSVNSIYRTVAAEPKYKANELRDAQTDAEELDRVFGELWEAMHYQLPDRFDVEGKGDPELYWTSTYTAVRDELFDAAFEANVEFPEDSFSWSAPTEREEIRRALVRVSLVEHMVRQLIAAHESVTDGNFDALGLYSIGEFSGEAGTRQGRPGRRLSSRPEPADQVAEERIGFEFEADNATLHEFLENCRSARPRVAVDEIRVERGRRPGDPLRITGALIALSIAPISAGEN